MPQYLDRSAIIMRLAVCASALRDEDKITHIAEMVPEIDSARYSRDAASASTCKAAGK